MSALGDPRELGAPYVIGQAIAGALREHFKADPAVRVMDNPKRASDLSEGARLVVYEDAADRPVQQAGSQSKRSFSFNLATINRTVDARTGAHQDYREAKRVAFEAIKGLHGTLTVLSQAREGEVVYRLENIDVGGGLVLGNFSIEYSDPR